MKAKRKPYQPKIKGSMSFPLEYDGDTVAKFLATAKYTGLLSYKKGLKIIDLKPRWYPLYLIWWRMMAHITR